MSKKDNKKITKETNQLLLKKRIVRFYGELENGSEKSIADALENLSIISKKPIHLLINSGGGDANGAFFLYDKIRTLRSPVTGFINGSCMSSAIIVLQACTKRVATRNSLFFLHFLENSPQIPALKGKKFKNEIEKILKGGEDLQERMEKAIAQRICISKKELREMMREGTFSLKSFESYFSAEDAKQMGFIDEIIDEIKLL